MKYFGTSHYTPAARWIHVALILFLPLGCKGTIGAPESAPFRNDTTKSERVALPPSLSDSAAPSGMASDGGEATNETAEVVVQKPRFQCMRSDLRGTNNVTLRRLTKDEYLQSAASVFGAAIVSSPEVQQAATQIPAETAGDITRELQNAYTYDHAAGILMTSQAIAKQVVDDPATRARVIGVCSENTNRECAAQYLADGARRILRRPLDAARITAMLDAFSEAGEGNLGLELLLARLLQAPEAIFHMAMPRQQCKTAVDSVSAEDSTCQNEAAQGLVMPADDWTVADRVSYALTGRGPDQELLDAAAHGQLRSPAEVRPHAERLLNLPEARLQLESILDAWLSLRTLPTPAPAVASNAAIDPVGLNEEARRELLDYAVYEILDLEVDAQTLMTDAVGFPRSQRMAKLYGVAETAQGSEPVNLPNGHGGLLVRIAPLLSGTLRTSPILRGVYVRSRLLCDELVSPDFAVVQARTEAVQQQETEKLTSRQLSEKITEPQACMACHTQINPLGFTLEGFDALGARRDEELSFDAEGNEVGSLPIDTGVEHASIEDGAPDQLADATALLRALASGTKYQACIAERFYTQAQMRRPSGADICALSEVEAVLRSGQSVKSAWLAAVLNPDMFVRQLEGSP